MNHLSDLVTDIFPDSKIASKFSSKHTKTRCIVKNVIATRFRHDIDNILKTTKFSIIIDESTDISSKKQLAIVVRFFCNQRNQVKSKFFKLIDVTKSDATTLTSALISLFEKKNISIENIIGFASDTTNVMFGEHHSVVSLLKQKIPNLFVMKCLCHSAHLCASHACEKLPRAVEDLICDVYSYFCHSAKRIAEFEQFQHFTGTQPHKLLKPAQTCWFFIRTMCCQSY